jgi:ferredoxin
MVFSDDALAGRDKTKMKGVICYYSGSGNTKLACKAIIRNLAQVEFDLYDITKKKPLDAEQYDLWGFATFTDFVGPPQLFISFMEGLPVQKDRWAFILNTYGYINGRTLLEIDKIVNARGFRVLAGHSLHTPESYPPMIAAGRGNEQAPNEQELRTFKTFVADLKEKVSMLQTGQTPSPSTLRVGLVDRFIPVYRRTHTRDEMGEKFVDDGICKACGVCEKRCPYHAITLAPKPVFDMGKCYGCWACYNHCPNHAIYTRKYRGKGYYPRPLEELRQKLDV